MPIPMNPIDLGTMYGMNPGAFQQSQGLWKLGQQQQQQELASSLQDMYEKQQKLPVELDYKRALTDQSRASATHLGAQTEGLNINNRMNNETFDLQKKAKITKLAAEMSDDDWKKSENALRQALIDPNEKVREKAKMLLPYMMEIQKERMKQTDRSEAQLELQRLRGEDALRLQREKAASAERIAKQKEADASLKMSAQQAVIYYRNKKSQVDPNSQEYAMYEALEANALRDWFASEQLKGVAPGQIDPSKTTNLPQATPAPAPAPAQLPGAAPAASAPSSPQPYQVGKEYQGRTGTYRYKGGDPAKKESWEKVK